jgi:hypothetical protein
VRRRMWRGFSSREPLATSVAQAEKTVTLKDGVSPYLVLFIVDADCATAERGDGLLIVGGKLGIGLGPGVNQLLKLRDGHCVRDDLGLPADVAIGHGQQRDHDHQRPQAELKPAAIRFRRVGFGRLGLHGRITRDRGQPEQGILPAGFGRVDNGATRAPCRCSILQIGNLPRR